MRAPLLAPACVLTQHVNSAFGARMLAQCAILYGALSSTLRHVCSRRRLWIVYGNAAIGGSKGVKWIAEAVEQVIDMRKAFGAGVGAPVILQQAGDVRPMEVTLHVFSLAGSARLLSVREPKRGLPLRAAMPSGRGAIGEQFCRIRQMCGKQFCRIRQRETCRGTILSDPPNAWGTIL
jgi:hypothetical protein